MISRPRPAGNDPNREGCSTSLDNRYIDALHEPCKRAAHGPVRVLLVQGWFLFACLGVPWIPGFPGSRSAFTCGGLGFGFCLVVVCIRSRVIQSGFGSYSEPQSMGG